VIYPYKRIFTLLPIVIFIVIADEFLKYFSLDKLPSETDIIDPNFIEFAIHKNFGMAFDIPFRLGLIILFSVIIGAFLAHIAYKNYKKHPDISFSALVIIIGAAGNLYDRLAYGFTVDYLLILGRSAINLSDLIIITGVVLMLMASRRSRSHHKVHPNEPKR
jgi:signal peptidase II